LSFLLVFRNVRTPCLLLFLLPTMVLLPALLHICQPIWLQVCHLSKLISIFTNMQQYIHHLIPVLPREEYENLPCCYITTNTCMQETLAQIFQTLIEHELLVILQL
jgi:hypothetical protein